MKALLTGNEHKLLIKLRGADTRVDVTDLSAAASGYRCYIAKYDEVTIFLKENNGNWEASANRVIEDEMINKIVQQLQKRSVRSSIKI